jgi:hypothetical protein
LNSCFRGNALLANTALILLCYIRGVFVLPRTRRKLLGRKTHRDRVPELILPLTETYSRITTKQQLHKIEWNIKMIVTQRLKG